MLEIENEYELKVLTETDEYKLVGLPFLNKKARLKEFEEAFSKALSIKLS